MKFFIAILFILQVLHATSQSSVELGFFVRYDHYDPYALRYFNRVFTDEIALSGISYGLNINYYQAILKHVKFNIGVGYDRVGIDHIKDTHEGVSSYNRPLNYRPPSGILPGFTTSHYNYNNLCVMGGMSFEVKIDTNAFLTFGADVNYKYTVSQQYHINWDGGINSRTTEGRPLGFGVNSYIGVLEQFRNKKFYINPKLMIHLYTMIYGDSIFSESEQMKIEKDYSGLGLSVSIGDYIWR